MDKNECLILVDNSNTFICGQELSAQKRELEYDKDFSWRIDFGALLDKVANGHQIIKAVLVGSTPPPKDSLWQAAKQIGFEVVTYARGQSGEKSIDTEIVACGLDVIYEHPRPAVLKLLSGDRDFVPLVQRAYKKGWETELWGFSRCISNTLQQMAHRVILLDDLLEVIGRHESPSGF